VGGHGGHVGWALQRVRGRSEELKRPAGRWGYCAAVAWKEGCTADVVELEGALLLDIIVVGRWCPRLPDELRTANLTLERAGLKTT